jgi:hypothetical protein
VYIVCIMPRKGGDERRKKAAGEKRERRNFRACETAVCAYASGKIINNFMSPDKEILILCGDFIYEYNLLGMNLRYTARGSRVNLIEMKHSAFSDSDS